MDFSGSIVPRNAGVDKLGTETKRFAEVNANKLFLWVNGVKVEVVPGAGGGTGSGEAIPVYWGTDASGNLVLMDSTNWGRILPLPMPTPGVSDRGKAILVNSAGTSFEFGEVSSGGGVALANGSMMFTAPGSYTFTALSSKIFISGCGAGGGGNGSHGLGGGGAQCGVRIERATTVGELLTTYIGAGGTGGGPAPTTSYTVGGDGESSYITGSFGKVNFQGGFGAIKLNGSTVLYNPGLAGGWGGQRGAFPYRSSHDTTNLRSGGKGGDCLYGFGGQGGIYANAPSYGTRMDGETGGGYGSGGGGGAHIFDGTASTAAGNGANGMVLLEW